MANVIPFNPLDKKNLGASVAEALLTKEVHPLSSVEPFHGAGIYSIYYTGPFAAYESLAIQNRNNRFNAPIYVGKAVPKGARRGANLEADPGRALHKRLIEHAESVRAAENLSIEDFFCRFLVVDDIWIPLGESLIIARFVPVWNTLIDGFGNHDPGSGRYLGMRPRWDVLHPGRSWASRLKDRNETDDDIGRDAASYLANAPIVNSEQFIDAECD